MFWNFKNIGEEETELRIDGDIVDDSWAWIYEWFGETATSPNAFREILKEHKGKNITIWIDSYGGDVFAAAGIYNALKEHKGKKTVKIDGKAMSAASVIAMAGDQILMSPVGMIMIHNPWSSVRGDAIEMRKAASVLDEVKETILNAYQSKTGKSRKKIASLMDDETYMSAKTALNNGFINEIMYAEKEQVVENSISFSGGMFRNSVNDGIERFFEMNKRLSQKSWQDLPLNTYKAKLQLLERKLKNV